MSDIFNDYVQAFGFPSKKFVVLVERGNGKREFIESDSFMAKGKVNFSTKGEYVVVDCSDGGSAEYYESHKKEVYD